MTLKSGLSLYGLVSGMELSEKNPGGVKTNKNPLKIIFMSSSSSSS
jgi:hypothetical protein